MKFNSKHYRRWLRSFVSVATGVSLASFVLLPTSNIGAVKKTSTDNGFYKIVINDMDMGYVESVADARKVYEEARNSFCKDSVAYSDVDFAVYAAEAGHKADYTTTLHNIEASLKSNEKKSELVAGYTIRVNDFCVTLASQEDVIKVLENVKSDYDEANLFQVAMTSAEDNEYKIAFKESSIASVDVDKVSAQIVGDQAIVSPITEDTIMENGLLAIGFSEDVKVLQVNTTAQDIMSVEDATEAITKKTAAKETYTIQDNDCLYNVAIKYDMTKEELYAVNDGFNENTVVFPGDKVVVTVPTPEISVVYAQEESYEEEFYADVEYIDDNSMYVGQSSVVREAVPGKRHVDVAVTYKDGVAVSTTIINEQIESQPVSKVVKRGTLTAPTYIFPLTFYYYISEEFGYRDWTGSFHGGLDYASPTGTTVMASRSGTVTYAGWKGSYGNTVEITHGDGHMTRYAHLSGFACSVGDYVNQYETIGYVGSTGFSTGPHLHFEIIVNGVQTNPHNWL